MLKVRGIMAEDQADRFTHALLDIREACRHIDYHLKDAKLLPDA